MRNPVEVSDASSRTKVDQDTEFKGMTALIVDDIATNRLVASSFLKLLNFDTIEAASGAQAIEILHRSGGFDLILLDIKMPVMDGLTTLQAIRSQIPGGSALCIIAMTANASAQDRHIYLQAGMDGYVSKPMDLAGLRAEIRRSLRR